MLSLEQFLSYDWMRSCKYVFIFTSLPALFAKFDDYDVFFTLIQLE